MSDDERSPDAPPSAGIWGLGVTARGLAAVLGAALFVRLCIHLLIVDQVEFDSATYDLFARNLLDQHVYSHEAVAPFTPSLFRPPGYPVFLAVIYTILGRHLAAVQLVQVGVSLLVGAGLGRLAEARSKGLGPWVLWALALCPFDAVYCIALLSENLAGALLTGAMIAILTQPRTRGFALAGLCVGLATLVRDIYIAFLPFLAALWAFGGEGERRDRVKQAAILCLVGGLAIAPWTARNYSVSGRFIPTSAGRLGFSLWLGTWATSPAGIGDSPDGTKFYPPDAYLHGEADKAMINAIPLLPPAEQELAYKALFKQRFRERPVGALGSWVVRIPKLWLGTRFDIFTLEPRFFPYWSMPWMVLKVGFYGLNLLYVALGFAGSVLAIRRRSPLRFWVSLLAFTALVYMPLNGFENRYSQPAYPVLAALAAYALRAIFLYVRARSRGEAPAAEAPAAEAPDALS